MTKNPFYNAGLATLYIVFVVSIINFGSKWAENQTNANILMPMGMLSFFVISAAIMGYIVLYQPIVLLLDGKRDEGLKLFLRTIGVFSAVALLLVIAAFVVNN